MIASNLQKNSLFVLSVGAKFLYVIPGFDTLRVDLQHNQMKRFSKIGNLENMFDIQI